MLHIFKVKKPILKLCLTILFIVRAVLMYRLNMGCPWKNVFGVACFGCGLTSAFFSLLQFNFLLAFRAHFMFWSIPILYAYVWFDGRLIGRRKVDNFILLFLLSGFFVRWILYLL